MVIDLGLVSWRLADRQVAVLVPQLLSSYFRDGQSQISAEKNAELMEEVTMSVMFSDRVQFGPCVLVGC